MHSFTIVRTLRHSAIAAAAASLLLALPTASPAQAPPAQPGPALGEGQAAAPAPPDQVAQLAQLIGLSEEQQTDIREVMSEIGTEIDALQIRAQALHQQLDDQTGHDFDEDKVRETATELGEVSGQLAAKSVILQSTVEGIFTEEQRDQLDELERQQRQQQELQQQQMQQQLQQQLQQQQEQQSPQAPQGQPQAPPQPQAPAPAPQPLPAPQP